MGVYDDGAKIFMAKDALENPSSRQNGVSVEIIPAGTTGTPSGDVLTTPEPVIEAVEQSKRPSERRQIVKAATLVMMGNLGSSIMGMVRQIVVASLGTNVAGPFVIKRFSVPLVYCWRSPDGAQLARLRH